MFHLTMILFSSLHAPLPAPLESRHEVPSAIAVAERFKSAEQAVISISALEYYFVHGSWTRTLTGSVERWVPVGSDDHFVEILVAGSGREPTFIEFPQRGELFVTRHSLLLDFDGRGRIEFAKLSQPAPACDGAYSNVQDVTFSGGCWSPMIADPETGAFEKKCNRNNGQACNATITFTNGNPAKNPTFTCGQQADRKVSGNSTQHTAFVSNANDGTC